MKITAAILLGTGLMIPLVAQDRDEHKSDRYYDSDHKDYHEWNATEQRAWQRYWQEQHHAAIDWQRAKEEQRRAYWRWRHDHPDRDDRR